MATANNGKSIFFIYQSLFRSIVGNKRGIGTTVNDDASKTIHDSLIFRTRILNEIKEKMRTGVISYRSILLAWLCHD